MTEIVDYINEGCHGKYKMTHKKLIVYKKKRLNEYIEERGEAGLQCCPVRSMALKLPQNDLCLSFVKMESIKKKKMVWLIEFFQDTPHTVAV